MPTSIVRLGDPAFRRGDVRAALQQLRRDAGRDRWRLHIERRGGQTERRRRLADEGGDRVLVLGAHNADIGCLHPGHVELRLRLRHVGFRRVTARQAILGETQRVGVCFDRVVQQALLGVGAAQFDVIHRQFSMQAEADGLQIGGGCLPFLPRGRDGAPDAAP